MAETPIKNTPLKITPLPNPPLNSGGFTEPCITTRARPRIDNINNIYNNINNLVNNSFGQAEMLPFELSPEPAIPVEKNAEKKPRAADAEFAEFWAAYPRKVAKKGAHAAYLKARKDGADAETILAGAKRFAASRPDPQYTPHPATWLNRGQWEDAVPASNPPTKSGGNSTPFFETQTGKEMLARLGREGAEARYRELLNEVQTIN
jgi:hypothetical protein